MAHHGETLNHEMQRFAGDLGLGPTRQFPRGKINPTDEGEITIGVTADMKTDTVIMNFGGPVSWIGLTADQANSLACSLFARAMEIKTTAHQALAPAEPGLSP